MTVLTQESPAGYTVSGIATFGDADSIAGASAVLFDDTTAERVLASPGHVDGVVVRSVDGVSEDELLEQVAETVPGLDVVSGSTLVAEDQAALHDAFGPFKVFLLVFAFVAVFVGAFMINNTFSIIVAQRTQQLAMLRALGASRRQVLRIVLTEATFIGVLGSFAGLAAGIGTAIGLRAMFVGMGVDLPSGPLVISTGSMVWSAGVGIAVTVLSAWLPARRAGRVSPIAALRDVARSTGAGPRVDAPWSVS